MFQKSLGLSFCVLWICGCSTAPTTGDRNLSIETASVSFERAFPKKWPANPVPLPLSASHKRTIGEMVMAVSKKLTTEHIAFETISPYKIKILPADSHPLNSQALALQADGIALIYDAFYFAKNPFSAGTFNEDNQELLISHNALETEASTSSVLAHEMVHVETFRDRAKRKQSPYYCRFKGPQFEPHYLACDEMKAYNQDLARMMATDAKSGDIERRLKVAKTHTDSIPELIDQLDFSTLKIHQDVATLEGSNQGKSFTVEFPSFVLENDGKDSRTAKEYMAHVHQVARAYKDFLNNIKVD